MKFLKFPPKLLKTLNSLSGIELSFLIVIALLLFISLEDATSSQPISGSSPDAKEIAAAISTPPAHLHKVLWQNIYHWQTLIAGFFAAISGAVVFLQVQKQIRSAEEIAAADRKHSMDVLKLQDKLNRISEANTENKNAILMCSALISEISVIKEEFTLNVEYWDSINNNNRHSLPIKHRDVEITSFAFEKYMDQIGMLEQHIQEEIFSIYSRALKWNEGNKITDVNGKYPRILSDERTRISYTISERAQSVVAELRRSKSEFNRNIIEQQ